MEMKGAAYEKVLHLFYCQYYVFPPLNGKGIGLPHYLPQGGPTGWLAERKSSSLRSGIFFHQALRKKAIQRSEAYKIGKIYPDGIIHSLKNQGYETTTYRNHLQTDGHTGITYRNIPAI